MNALVESFIILLHYDSYYIDICIDVVDSADKTKTLNSDSMLALFFFLK